MSPFETASGIEPPRFSCLHSRAGATVTVAVKGELDMATSPQLDDTLRNMPAVSRVVLDLRELDFMDSTGLHVVVAANQRIRGRGGQLLVVRGPAAIERLFAISGVDRGLDLVDRPPDQAASEARDSTG